MATSKSGQIRRQIGLVKTRVSDLLGKSTESPWPLVDREKPLIENIDELKIIKPELLTEKERLGRAVDQLAKLNQDWNQLIGEIQSEGEQAKEEERYDNATQGESDFLTVLHAGEDRIDQLIVWLGEIEDTIKELSLQHAVAPDPFDLDQSNTSGHYIITSQTPGNRDRERLNTVTNVDNQGLPEQGNVTQGVRGRDWGVNLPTIQLPKFNGDPLQFSDFWDAYESAVHNKDSLTPVQKFTYLKGLLVGPALNAIAGISVNNVNYSVALTQLQNRFGKKEVVVDMLYKQFRNLAVAKTSKAVDLRQLIDEIEKILRQLEVLGEDISHHSLVGSILELVPKGVILRLHEQYKSKPGPWDMLSLRYALSQLVQTHEGIFGEASVMKAPQTSFKRPPYHGREASNQVSMFTGQSRMGTVRTPKCMFCERPHFSDECTTYKTMEMRKKHFREMKRCFICTKKNCFAKSCSAPVRECAHCKQSGKHSRMLCPMLFTTKSVTMALCSETSVEEPNQVAENHTLVASEQTEVQVSSDAKKETTLQPGSLIVVMEGTHKESMEIMASVVDEDTDTRDKGQVRPEVQLNANASDMMQSNFLNTNECVIEMMTKRVTVMNPVSRQKTQVKLLFDSGSHTSFILARVAKLLKLESICKTKMSINTFGNQKLEFDSDLVEIDLAPMSGTESISVQAYTTPKLTGPLKGYVLAKSDIEFLRPIQNVVELKEEQEISIVELIIGMDHFWKLIEPTKVQLPSGLFFLQSKLGPIISGQRHKFNQKKRSDNIKGSCVVVLSEESGSLDNREKEESNTDITFSDLTTYAITDKDLERFWSLESIGIMDNPQEIDDEIALDYFLKTIQRVDGRYTVSLPWVKNCPNLPANYQLAHNRLVKLVRKLLQTPTRLVEYDNSFKLQEKTKVIEEVNREDSDGRVHYIPHHPVLTPDKLTTKMRIVYDASARRNKLFASLNNCMYRGPVLMPDLTGILLKFRIGPVAMVSDIEKAFHQVGLNVTDRDVTRFLWLKDINKPVSEENIKIYRFCRVPFGLVSSPFLLGATLKYHLQENGSTIANNSAESLYVDNLAVSLSTTEEAFSLYRELRQLLLQVKMNLREWATNCPTLQSKIPSELRCPVEIVKMLGINWNTNTDMFNLTMSTRVHEACKQGHLTKRIVLQGLASLFDPLGLFSPVSLVGKLFIKQLWAEKFEWDELLPESYKEKWGKIEASLMDIPKFHLKRYLGKDANDPKNENILMAFSDASAKAYATTVYLRTQSVGQEEGAEVSLIFAKSRVAKEDLTLPRLELMAVLIGVRATCFIKKHLKIPIAETFILTDSKIVLGWIGTSRPLGTFVGNRVKEIASAKNTKFLYVSGKLNPADCASRGLTPQQLWEHNLWWHGPDWVSMPINQWPELRNNQSKVLNAEETVKFDSEVKNRTETQVNVAVMMKPIIEIARFSQFQRLVNTVKLVIQFLHLKVWDKLSESTKEKYRHFGNLVEKIDSVTLGKRAKRVLVREMQRFELSNLYAQLERENECWTKPKAQGQYRELGPQLGMDGIIRLTGRYKNIPILSSGIDRVTRREWMPILMPPDARLTRLLIEDIHTSNWHMGVQYTLATLRKMGFWCPKGRLTVRRILKLCVTCKKIRGGAYKLPPMAPLPIHRLQRAPAFQNIGLDYFGPLTIKIHDEKRKAWVCLITCLVTRAVHLELVSNMTAGAFLNAFRRFVSRRGKPDRVISDNAPQFRLASQTLKSGFQKYKGESLVNNYFKKMEINWEFITEYAPWQGGVYERLVGVTKRAIGVAIRRRHLEWDEIHTIISEIEAVVNRRPLTTITEELEGRCLRPIDLIQHNCETGAPSLDEEDRNDPDYVPKGISSKDKLLTYWKQSQQTVNAFWRSFYEDYTLSLPERTQRYPKTPRITAQNTPLLNEIVIVYSPNTHRDDWKMAQIVELTYGRDKEIRSAIVRFSNGSTTKRPINYLIPLELRERDSVEKLPESNICLMIGNVYELPDSGAGCSTESEVFDLPPPPPVLKLKEPNTSSKLKKFLPMKLGNVAACLPERGSKEAAGIDLYSSNKLIIQSTSWGVVDTAVYVKLPQAHFGLIAARSGLAVESGVTTLCGIVDSDYVGPLKVVLMNHGKKALVITAQQRVAQLIVIPYLNMEPKRVEELPGTERGQDGFGSSGKGVVPTKPLPPELPTKRSEMKKTIKGDTNQEHANETSSGGMDRSGWKFCNTWLAAAFLIFHFVTVVAVIGLVIWILCILPGAQGALQYQGSALRGLNRLKRDLTSKVLAPSSVKDYIKYCDSVEKLLYQAKRQRLKMRPQFANKVKKMCNNFRWLTTYTERNNLTKDGKPTKKLRDLIQKERRHEISFLGLNLNRYGFDKIGKFKSDILESFESLRRILFLLIGGSAVIICLSGGIMCLSKSKPLFQCCGRMSRCYWHAVCVPIGNLIRHCYACTILYTREPQLGRQQEETRDIELQTIQEVDNSGQHSAVGVLGPGFEPQPL